MRKVSVFCHSRVGGNPVPYAEIWIPIFMGMTEKPIIHQTRTPQTSTVYLNYSQNSFYYLLSAFILGAELEGFCGQIIKAILRETLQCV